MFSTSDTIVAIATPPGRGGIGVVRLSGPEAHRIACRLTGRQRPLEPRHATFLTLHIASADQTSPSPVAATDHAIATYFPAPASYTGEAVVELSAHGSPVILRSVLSAAVTLGARLAQPGEFTLRAFLNGRMDLVQAEAVADLIDAVTPLQARAAFDQLQGTLTSKIRDIDADLMDLIARLEASIDFPEEGYHFIERAEVERVLASLTERTARLMADAQRGRLLREGLVVAIVGRPNVGKSSVFNALVGASRAIVASRPGTTRDMLTEIVDLDGLRVTLVDTAGVRTTTDEVEREGVERARQASDAADVVLVVLDGSCAIHDDDRKILAETERRRRVVAVNKSDLPAAWHDASRLSVSAKTCGGIADLRRELVGALDFESLTDPPAITNMRHSDLVRRAHEALALAQGAAAGQGLAEEFILADLQEARCAFDEVMGRRTPEDVLAHIFERFCVGK
jgi:tRNA modification GTPase